MNWIYLSYPWGPSCPPYGGGEPIRIQSTRSLTGGDSCNTLQFVASNHIGTHFDFPRHFHSDGKTVLDYDADHFIFNRIGLVWLTQRPGELVTAEQLAQCSKGLADDVDCLLIRTGAGSYRHEEKYWRCGPGMQEGSGDYLRERFPALRLIVLDCISISSFVNRDIGRSVHREYLNAARPLLIIEDAYFPDSLHEAKIQKLIALPLRIEGGDGAPCTIIAKL